MAKILILLTALQHFLIMMMEMFMWEKRGPKIFKSFDKELFKKTTAIAKNMGLYNGFIASGLIVSLFLEPSSSFIMSVFFLICVVVAGIYASLTAEKTIFIKQSLIAVLSLIALFIA